MVPGEQQQILVKATWKDGKTEDVTATAQFDTLNDGVAAVTPGGLVTAKNRGETHIMVRFCGQATVFQVTLPYAKIEKYPAVARNNFIDDRLIAKWKDLGLTPSPLCSDDEFFRRIHLDTIGTLPTPDEIKAFNADKSPDKRAKAIDKVLARPEFVDFWAQKWGDLLRINRDALNERGACGAFITGSAPASATTSRSTKWCARSSPPRGAPTTEEARQLLHGRQHAGRLGGNDVAAFPRRSHRLRQVPSSSL